MWWQVGRTDIIAHYLRKSSSRVKHGYFPFIISKQHMPFSEQLALFIRETIDLIIIMLGFHDKTYISV